MSAEDKKEVHADDKRETEVDSDDEGTHNVSREGKKADFEGFLQKRGDKGLIKGWKKRYFRLYDDEGVLSYFKSEKDFKEIGAIDLKGALIGEKFTGKANAFSITMKTSARVWYLQADKPALMDDWMNRIKKHIKEYNVPKPVPANANTTIQDAKKKVTAPKEVYTEPEEKEIFRSVRKDAPESFEVPQIALNNGETAIVMHQNGKVFVQEIRAVKVGDDKTFWIKDLPIRVDSDSVQLVCLNEPAATVLESNFIFDEKAPEELLAKIRGKGLKVEAPRRDEFADPRTFEGTVVYDLKANTFALRDSAKNAFHFLKTSDVVSYFVAADVPADSVEFREPALHCKVTGNQSSDLIFKLSYNVKDSLEWKAEYWGTLNVKEQEMEVTGWFVVHNKSGRCFPANTHVSFIADKVPEESEKKEEGGLASEAMGLGMAKLGGLAKLGSGLLGGGDAKAPKQTRVHKYHYGHATSFPDQHHKQLQLVSAKVPVKSMELIRFNTPKYSSKVQIADSVGAGDISAHAETVVEFANNVDCKLGKATLPSGQFHVMRTEKYGLGAEELACVAMPHREIGELVTLVVDPYSKVSASRKQTGFNFDRPKNFIIETFEINISNGRDEFVEVVCEDTMYRWNHWEITASNFPYQSHEHHPRKIYWKLPPLAPGNSHKLTYTVFYFQFISPEAPAPQ